MEKKINERKSLLREAEKVASLKPRRPSVFAGILTKIIIILILIMIILGGVYYVFTKKMQPKKEVNIAVVQTQLSY